MGFLVGYFMWVNASSGVANVVFAVYRQGREILSASVPFRMDTSLCLRDDCLGDGDSLIW